MTRVPNRGSSVNLLIIIFQSRIPAVSFVHVHKLTANSPTFALKGNCMSCATKFKVYFSKVEICPGLNAAAKTAKSAKIWKISQV